LIETRRATAGFFVDCNVDRASLRHDSLREVRRASCYPGEIIGKMPENCARSLMEGKSTPSFCVFSITAANPNWPLPTKIGNSS
jgi:hypothetical protein